MSDIYCGRVKWFNVVKGFGFVTTDQGKDIFIHKTDVPEQLVIKEGDRIEFELAQTQKGHKAVNIAKL